MKHHFSEEIKRVQHFFRKWEHRSSLFLPCFGSFPSVYLVVRAMYDYVWPCLTHIAHILGYFGPKSENYQNFFQNFSILGHIRYLLGPKMGPIWKFSISFPSFVISSPNDFHRGVMILYFAKSGFLPILSTHRARFWPKNGPDTKNFEFFFKILNLYPKRFP